MAVNSSYKFAVLFGIFAGIISCIPIISGLNLCCCLPLVLASAGSVSFGLGRNKSSTMTTVNAAMTGVIAAGVATLVNILGASLIIIVLYLIFPQIFDTYMSQARELLEPYGIVINGLVPALLQTLGQALFFGMVGTVFSALTGVATLHLAYKDRHADA